MIQSMVLTAEAPSVAPGALRRGRPRGRSHLAPVLSETYLRREYERGGRSSLELAGELGCSPKTILRYLELFDIPTRSRGERRSRYPQLQSGSYLRRVYLVEGRTPTQIAADLGCSRPAVVAALRHAGLRREGTATGARWSEADLREAYVQRRRSTSDIAAELGCAPATVARWLRQAGIDLRPRGGDRSARTAGSASR